jgi:hypothetical protein
VWRLLTVRCWGFKSGGGFWRERAQVALDSGMSTVFLGVEMGGGKTGTVSVTWRGLISGWSLEEGREDSRRQMGPKGGGEPEENVRGKARR